MGCTWAPGHIHQSAYVGCRWWGQGRPGVGAHSGAGRLQGCWIWGHGFGSPLAAFPSLTSCLGCEGLSLLGAVGEAGLTVLGSELQLWESGECERQSLWGVRPSHSLSGVRTLANVSVHFVLLNRLLIYVWRPVSRTSLQPSQMLASTKPQADGGGPGGPPWNEAPNRDSVWICKKTPPQDPCPLCFRHCLCLGLQILPAESQNCSGGIWGAASDPAHENPVRGGGIKVQIPPDPQHRPGWGLRQHLQVGYSLPIFRAPREAAATWKGQ